MKTKNFAFLNRFSLLRISWIEAEDISKAIDTFRQDWGDTYQLTNIMVMEQEIEPENKGRWWVVTDSIQEWLEAVKNPILFGKAVVDSIIS
jgi:hypothetical protein